MIQKKMNQGDTESNTKMVLLSESGFLYVIRKWYYFQNQGASESNTKMVLLSESG